MNSNTVIRVLHNHSTEDWLDHMHDLFESVSQKCQGTVTTIPGPMPGEVDWMFDTESDASWFILKYDGTLVTHNEITMNFITDRFLG